MFKSVQKFLQRSWKRYLGQSELLQWQLFEASLKVVRATDLRVTQIQARQIGKRSNITNGYIYSISGSRQKSRQYNVKIEIPISGTNLGVNNRAN